ncbi:MAG: hypothetical protein CMQ29_01285 [Gammaproteobacteria bacterium]|nr:hypothetical protein [Gammaproteobacteria bacterium]
MHPNDIFAERAVQFHPPPTHFTLIIATDGQFLASASDSTLLTREVSDAIVWQQDGNTLSHPDTGMVLTATQTASLGFTLVAETPVDASAGPFELAHGPELRPSTYLEHLRTHGWVVLNSIMSPETIEALERMACTDRYRKNSPDRSQPQICQDPVLARVAVEPISLWLAREYMQTDQIRLAHTPGIGVLMPDDGERAVQGWHSDYPYHWGINAAGKVPTPSGRTVMGVQRIVCVSEYTKVRGATAFKLGSHLLDSGPPEDWGLAQDTFQPGHRAEHGLPYNGPNADVIEAPAGSVILFDTRTWHRAGVNRTDAGRAAILMDTTPAYIIPYSDTSADYKALTESSFYAELNHREQAELQELMVHRFLGPAGPRSVIGTHHELSALLGRPRP